MRRFLVLPVVFVSMAFLSGCNQISFSKAEEKPLTLVTPKGFSKPVPIEAAKPLSWEKKALLAMIAPSIAEQIEQQHSGLKPPANQKPTTIASNPVPAKVAKATKSHKANRRVVASNKHKKAQSKQIASTKKPSHPFVAAKF